MRDQPVPNHEELWRLVQKQQAEIDRLKARQPGHRSPGGVNRALSVVLSLCLIVVVAAAGYAAIPAHASRVSAPSQTGYYVRWNGTRWVSSYIQPTDVPPLPLAGDLSGNQYGATVTGLQGVPLSQQVPVDGQVLEYSSADGKWEPGFYRRTVIVSPVIDLYGHVDPIASGTALLAAMSKVANASASDPYLVHLEPGTYDLGTQTLAMQPNVDIEGSGQGVTTITSAIAPPTLDSERATVTGADNAELRNLTVLNKGNGGDAIHTGSSTRLTGVTTATTSGTSLDQLRGSVSILNSTLNASSQGPAIRFGGGVLGVVNSKVVGNINSEGSLRIDRSTLIEGKIFVADMTTSIGASQVGDPVTVTGLPPTTVTCVDDYNASYAPLNSICQ